MEFSGLQLRVWPCVSKPVAAGRGLSVTSQALSAARLPLRSPGSLLLSIGDWLHGCRCCLSHILQNLSFRGIWSWSNILNLSQDPGVSCPTSWPSKMFYNPCPNPGKAENLEFALKKMKAIKSNNWEKIAFVLQRRFHACPRATGRSQGQHCGQPQSSLGHPTQPPDVSASSPQRFSGSRNDHEPL